MKAFRFAVLAALLALPHTASAATITLDGICTSFEFSPCFGSISMTIRASEATRLTTVSVSVSGPIRIINDATAFGFHALFPMQQYTGAGLAVTDDPIGHPALGTFSNSIDFLVDAPLISGFSFNISNPDGSLVLNPFDFNQRGLMVMAHVRNIETGLEGYRAARFFLGQQAEVIPLSPVPEPGSLILLGTGLVAAWRARRRRGPIQCRTIRLEPDATC